MAGYLVNQKPPKQPKLTAVYASDAEISALLKRADKALAWYYDDSLRSIRIGNTIYRHYFDTPAKVSEVLDALHAAGIEGSPGSYAWIWRKIGPRFRRGKLSGQSAAGQWPYSWCETFPGESLAGKVAYSTMDIPGPIHAYDMTSAYAWAITAAPLPLPSSARLHFKMPKKLHSPWAFACVEDPDPIAKAPPCTRGGALNYSADGKLCRVSAKQRVWIAVRDLARYGIRLGSVVRVVDFRAELDLRPCVDALCEMLPAWIVKLVLQRAWGTFCPAGKLRQVKWRAGKPVSSHSMTGMRFPELSGHTVSRVNARLHDVVERDGSLRVYVDSTMTTRRIETGSNWGDWRKVAEYPSIRLWPNHPGRVDGPHGPIKHAGEKNSQAQWRYIGGTL